MVLPTTDVKDINVGILDLGIFVNVMDNVPTIVGQVTIVPSEAGMDIESV